MYEYKTHEDWDEVVAALKKHLDIDPKPVKDSAKENIYVTDPDGEMCFDIHLMFTGLFNKIKKIQKENEELEEIVKNQAGWLASKELQTNMLARLEFLEKKLKVRAKE